MENVCPICGSPFKYIPAGVSKKTGKPYQPFYACSKYGCPGKPPKTNNQQYAPQIANSSPTSDFNNRVATAIKTLQEKVQFLQSENAILKDEMDKLKQEQNGVYQACIAGKCEDAYEMGKIKLRQPEIPIIDDGEEQVRIEDIKF